MNTTFIAELCTNHNYDEARLEQLTAEAAKCGFHAVKLQHGLEETWANEGGKEDIPLEWIEKAAMLAHDLGMECGCTVLGLSAFLSLERICDWLKVGSYELTWPRLIGALQGSHRPWMLSTGMATLSEVSRVVRQSDRHPPACLMYGISQYPVQEAEYPEHAPRILKALGLPIGYSDHTRAPHCLYWARADGASVIEVHLDLEDGLGLESAHSWHPGMIAPVIDQINPDWRERRYRRDPVDGRRPMRYAR